MSVITSPTVARDYLAVREGGAGLIDLSSRGRMLVSGADAMMFLNGLVTNDMKTLARHSWMPAAFANVQGRLLAVVRILHREDGFLLDTEQTTHDKVLALLDRFTLAGDFRVTDLTRDTRTLSVQGAGAPAIVRAVLGKEAANVERRSMARSKLSDGDATVIAASHTAEMGFDLFVGSERAAEVMDALISAGAQVVSDETFETLRIEAGIPCYGVDMDETTVVTETNLDDAISYTKGCYLGQEIVIRIKHRGHVAKKLTGVIMDEAVDIHRGASVVSVEGKDVGRVTSATYSPLIDRTIGLAYVKYDYLAPGTVVRVDSHETRIAASIAGLPFVRGSWYETALTSDE